MNLKATFLGSIAAVAMTAGASNAAVIDAFSSTTVEGDGFFQLADTSDVPTTDEIKVVWSTAPVAVYADFTTTTAFTFELTNYTPTVTTQQSGLALERWVGDGYELVIGSLSEFGQPSGRCGPAPDPIPADCALITGERATSNPDGAVQPDYLFGTFESGEYRLSFFDSGQPERGDADFLLTAVPVPAAGFLLLGALGGLAALRRRKS